MLCLNPSQLDLPLQTISVFNIEYCQCHLKMKLMWLADARLVNLTIQILSNILHNCNYPFLALCAAERLVVLRETCHSFLHDYNIYTEQRWVVKSQLIPGVEQQRREHSCTALAQITFAEMLVWQSRQTLCKAACWIGLSKQGRMPFNICLQEVPE